MLLNLFTIPGFISLATLIFLEIILGIDNIIFIALICSNLPKANQRQARVLGLTMALIFRIILLISISWLVRLIHPLFSIGSFDVSGRDLILFSGGLFLIYKTLKEIKDKLYSKEHSEEQKKTRLMALRQAIIQIALIDIIFSFDSILTAVGLSNDLPVMITAVVIAMMVMLFFAPFVSDFITNYPTMKILALVFLLAIGSLLVIESFHLHIERNYIYFGMSFSLIVELLNIRLRKVMHQSK